MPAKLQSNINPTDALKNAADAEADGDLEAAAKFYEQAIKDERLDEYPFTRLMIIYRKLKKYKDELRVINTGIRLFEQFYKGHSQKTWGSRKKLSELSTAFMKTAGLQDKKGNVIYQPEPIGKWLLRKAVVQKKVEMTGKGVGRLGSR